MLAKMATILRACTKPLIKNQIIEQCNLSSSTYKRYMSLLQQNDLLDVCPAPGRRPGANPRHRVTYQTSRRGEQFLKAYDNIMTLVSEG